MLLCDLAQTGAARVTRDGYLAVPARVAKANHVRRYYGSELGLSGDAAGRTYGVVTPDTELFSRDAMHSFAHKVFTVDHPASGNVNSENFKEAAAGWSGGEVARDGDYLVVPLLIADADAQAAVAAGRKQISAGYTVELDWTAPGTTASGEAYDAVARRPRCNHLAAVVAGRAGPDVKLALDAATGSPNMDLTRIVTLDAAKAELERLHRENQSLAGINAALRHTAQPRDAHGRPLLSDAQRNTMRDEAARAMRDDYARRTDPGTPYGAYLRRISDAWKNPPNAADARRA